MFVLKSSKITRFVGNRSRKKAFTLVELSVVLLVLSVLVGGLLVGRAIVDRARVQRIAQEVDFYRKAVIMFYDTYGSYPGNLERTSCSQYNEFSSISGLCTGASSIAPGYGSYQYIASNHAIPLTMAMRFMKFAGIIDNVSASSSDTDSAAGGTPCNVWSAATTCTSLPATPTYTNIATLQSYWTTKQTYAYSSFDQNIAIAAIGIGAASVDTASGYVGSKYTLNLLRGFGTSSTSPNEFSSLSASEFDSAIGQRNFLVFFNNVDSSCSTVSGVGCQQGSGAFTAAVLQSLDVKYDTGSPYYGAVVAIRTPRARNSSLTAQQQKAYCTTLEQQIGVSTSITSANLAAAGYISDPIARKNPAYGCNAMFLIQ
jgi:prepilin-type N-terminal cleavage/methylation domain-containing protein